MTEMVFHDPDLAATYNGLLEPLITRMRDDYLWEAIDCVMCGPSVSSSHAITKFGIDMRICDGCGHLFVSPRLPEAAVPELYGSAYWDEYSRAIGSPTLEERCEFDYQNGFGKLRRDVQPYRSSGRLLDVGASNGGMVRAAREAGFEAEGIEPSAEVCALAKRAHGIDLNCGDLRTIELAGGYFAVVVIHDVIEHVFDPVGILQASHRLLEHGGLMVIETPTTDAVENWLLGADWECMSPLEHVNLFSEKNLARLLRRCGFKILDFYCPHENNMIAVAEAA